MPRVPKSDKQRREREFWQGGKLPARLVKHQLAELRQARAGEIAEKARVQQQAARYLSQLQAPVEPAEGPAAEKALNGLRSLTQRLSKPKRAAKKPIISPIPVWGRYTLTFTPPNYLQDLGSYTNGQITSVTGNPTIAATGNETLGQMTCTVETNYDSPSSGTASNLLGVFFKPLFESATAEISFDSQLSFYWYVNSIRNKYAFSAAQGLIEIYQYDDGIFIEPPLNEGAFIGWSEDAINNLDFDFFSGAGPTWSLQVPVSSSYFYFVVFRLSAMASGSGWPGSLAGASATVTIPSITVTVTGNPLGHPLP
jgi:hypothetical protein